MLRVDGAHDPPVVLGDQIWITSATEDGRQLFAIAVDRQSGRIIHDLKVFDVAQPQRTKLFQMALALQRPVGGELGQVALEDASRRAGQG